MKFDFMVYRDKIFVESWDVNEALMGAMVEVFFVIRHYYMRDKKFDMFQVDIQQIRIVKPGGSIATSGFKQRNARDGLLDVIKVRSMTGKDEEEGRTEKRVRSDDVAWSLMDSDMTCQIIGGRWEGKCPGGQARLAPTPGGIS